MNASAFISDPRMTPTARLLLQVLERKARGYDECWSSTGTLAACLKCCDRTVRNALRQLASLGLVEIVRDYSRQTRRRIVLLWKVHSLFASVTANVSPQPTDTFSATNASPLDPPIGDELKKDDDGLSERPSSSNAPPPETRTPPAEVAGLVALAREHVSPDATPAQVVALLASTQASPAAVRVAIEETRGKGRNRWAYLVGAVRNIVRERGSDPAPAPAAAPAQTVDERAEATRAGLARALAPEAPSPPPTDDEVEGYRRDAAGARGPLHARLARLWLAALASSPPA